MDFIKKNYILILIFLLALGLRLNYDIFINGYNYDEIAIISTAVQNFPFSILNTAATNDYHAPLYQLIIHFFTYFNHEWVYIRIFNLLLSLINIFVFYKIGKLISNKKLGYILALIFCVNHLAISTVSFVKFYCMLFLFVSISIYYLFKILKYKKDNIKLGIINSLICLTSTYGVLLVFCEYILLILKVKIKCFKSLFISLIGFILYLPLFINQFKMNYDNVFSPHSYYSEFSLASLYIAINDFIGPLLNFCCNLITVESFKILLKWIKFGNPLYLIALFVFSIIPIIIIMYCAVSASIKDKFAKNLALIWVLYLFIFITLTKLELTGFVPIYLYALALILLVIAGVGFYHIKSKKIFSLLLGFYIFINLFITNCYPPQKRGIDRAKKFYCIEKYFRQNPNAALIVTEGGRFLKKYYKNEKIFDFDNEKMGGLKGRKYIELVFGSNVAKTINKNNAYGLISPLILNNHRDKAFEEFFIEKVYNKINKNETIVLAFFNDDNFPFLDEKNEYIKELKTLKYNPHLTESTIKKGLYTEPTELDTAIFSNIIATYSYEYLIDLLEKYFVRTKIEQFVRTNNDDFVKIFEDNTNKYATKLLATYANSSWVFITYQKQ